MDIFDRAEFPALGAPDNSPTAVSGGIQRSDAASRLVTHIGFVDIVLNSGFIGSFGRDFYGNLRRDIQIDNLPHPVL